MRKIPSIFIRDWEGNRALVTREINPECEWVFNGEGIPTRKWDGTCCMVRDHKLFKRYNVKFNKEKGIWNPKPEYFEPCQEPDEKTGHQPGWVPVDFEKKEDKWFKMAWNLIAKEDDYTKGSFYLNFPNPKYFDGTYELVGLNINGNPENFNGLYFVKHGYRSLGTIQGYEYNTEFALNEKKELKYDAIKKFLEYNQIEGIVWHHHPSGKMAKIKRVDFGLEWPIEN